MAALASDAGTLQLGHPYERLFQAGKAKRLWRDRVQAKLLTNLNAILTWRVMASC
jgi:hypothetical protein